jgi:outer membrane protein
MVKVRIDAMRSLLRIAALCAFAGITGVAGAQSPPDAAADAAADAVATPAPPPAPPLPPERSWRFGIAAGYGERTNPLIQSDDIPVLVDIDLAWFGRRWFFDNGDLGFSLIENDRFTTNLVARVNSDRAFFSKTNTRFVTFRRTVGGLATPAVNPDTGELLTQDEAVPLKAPKRDYAIEAGFETLIDGDWGAATLRAFHDVSGTHDGYEVSASYSFRHTRGRFSVSPSVGVTWKDDALSNYYWGVHPDESSFILDSYEARGGLSWEAGLRGTYYLTKRVRLAVSANYERLQHSVERSPIVAENHVFGYFAGVAWSF